MIEQLNRKVENKIRGQELPIFFQKFADNEGTIKIYYQSPTPGDQFECN